MTSLSAQKLMPDSVWFCCETYSDPFAAQIGFFLPTDTFAPLFTTSIKTLPIFPDG